MKSKEQIKRAYDELAHTYFEMRKNGGISHLFNEMVEMPTTLKLLGNIKGKKVLDLGCGPGRYARILTEKGAKVIGIDNSISSINIAKKEAPKAEFKIGDIEKLPFKKAEFDLVLSSLVIGHFKNWNKIFKEVKRVLRKDGLFLFSIHNPFKEVMVKKECEGKKFKVVEKYFDEGPIYDIWANENNSYEVSHHHKTYGTIIRTIIANGFEIVDYEDCKPIPQAKDKYPEKYVELLNMPNFCVWKLRKK